MWRVFSFLVLFVMGAFSFCAAQPKKLAVKNPQADQYNSPVLQCPVLTKTPYHKKAIGIKFGDPIALSYKYYENEHWSFVAEIGKSTSGLYNRYYREAFPKYLPDSLKANQSLQYLSHQILSDWFIEVKFLHQWELSRLVEGMNLYIGLGSQWRNTNIRYNYLYENIDPKVGRQTQVGSFDQSRFTYGLVAITGLEYSLYSLPLAAFLEVEYFTDGLVDTGYQRFQGGVGLRYTF